MQNGIFIENISLPNIQVERLYIKWNEKISISIDEAKIIKSSKKKEVKVDFKQINKLFKTLLHLNNLFEKIEIKKITFNNIDISFKYIEGQNGFLIASSNDFSLKSSLFFESNLFNAKIDEFHDYKRKIKIDGNIIFDGYDKIELISSLNLNINNDIKLKIYALANKQKLFYKIDSKKKIKSIKHTIEMIDMPKEVKYWVYDAIKMSDAELKYAYGWLDYENMGEALKNIHVLTNINNLAYTYNPSLEPVLSPQTELEFKDGILFIRPKEAYQYGFFLDKSWLKIDFTKKEELLTLFLLFEGKVTKDLLYLLNTYKIKLPILQNSGSVDTDLTITVGLRNIDVKANGVFLSSKEANFTYLGLDIDIFSAKVYLDNYDVTIKNMHSKYQDIATAVVDVKFDAKKSEGVIDFKVQDVNFKDIGLSLKKSDMPLDVRYTISQEQDFIDSKSSSWLFKGKTINVDKVTLPFSLKTLIAQIPTTSVNIKNLVSANISGTFLLNPIRANIDVDLLRLSVDDINMHQPKASLNVKYDNKIMITTNEKIRLNANNLDYILNKTYIEIEKNILKAQNSNIKIKNLLDADFSAKYDFNNNNATLNVKKIDLEYEDFGNIFSSKENIELKIKSEDTITIVDAKDLDINFTKNEKSWKLRFASLESLSKNSKLLKDYNITNGNFTISKYITDKNIKYNANIDFPYKIIAQNNLPTGEYTIEGEIDKNNLLLNINNSIDVKIDENIKINADNIAINIDEILNYFNDRNSTSNSKNINVTLNATNSHIYISKDRHIISDNINLQYFNKTITAQLMHNGGSADFELKNKMFYLYGENFNDEFMENLFALSKFKDGTLSFSMAGSINEYKGLMQINDTTILDYKILNNILAFVNTVPALVTFSLPKYSEHGLEVKNAYLNFNAKDDIFNLKDIYLDSGEIDIKGRGKASFKYNKIDLMLNLKSNLGSNASKIPVVGYILLGEDTVSTSMRISGKLNDPEVKSLIAKDIAVVPLNIIKRTLLLPAYLFKSGTKKKENE